jgi:hypothetical protein
MIGGLRNRVFPRSAPWQPLTEAEREQQILGYIREGRLGLALVVFRTLDEATQNRVIRDLGHKPLPHLPHEFIPRRHGSKAACEVCGAELNNELHTNREPAPPRPRPRRG